MNKKFVTLVLATLVAVNLFVFVVPLVFADDVVDSYSESNYSLGYSGLKAKHPSPTSTVSGISQSFTCGSDVTLSYAEWYLSRSGSPTVYLYARIYAITGTYGSNCYPTGSALASSDGVDASTITNGGYELVTFTFSGDDAIELEESTYYCLTIEAGSSGTYDSSNYVNVGTDVSTPTHSGNYALYYLSSWAHPSNGADFIFYVYGEAETDTVPYYSGAGDDGETEIGQSVDVFCNWFDDVGLDTCYFSTNNTGTWVNSSISVSGTDDWANTSITLNASLVVVQYMWYCNDTVDQWNVTSVYSITLTDPYPWYSDVADDGVTQVGSTVSCSIRWWDNYDLDTCYFSTNNTGVWANSSCTVMGAWSWANKSVTLNSTFGLTVQYMWYCSDSNNQWNVTDVYSIVTTSINVTFCQNDFDMGSFLYGGVELTVNSTVVQCNYNQSFSLMAVPVNASFVFDSFVWDSTSSETNPHTIYVVSMDEEYVCIFGSAGEGGEPESGFVFKPYHGLVACFGILVIMLVLGISIIYKKQR